MKFALVMTLNALSFSALLFLLASGFSLVFGLMRIPNMAHGAFFLVGGYLGAQAIAWRLPFLLAALFASLGLMLLGYMTERLLLRRLAGRELAQVLATLGLAFVLGGVTILVWGGMPLQVAAPSFASGPLKIGAIVFPAYRFFLVIVATMVGLVLWYFLDRTRLGAMIRAGVDDAPMAEAIGISVSTLFTTVFAIGAGLAGLGGVLAAPLVSVYPGLDVEMLGMALVVVIVGGIGSLLGSIVGSVAIGFIYTFGQAWFTEFAFMLLFVVMIAVLAVKPRGLFGTVS